MATRSEIHESLMVSRTLRFGWALASRVTDVEAELPPLPPTLPPSNPIRLRVEQMLAPFAELEKARANNDAEDSTDRVVFLRSSEASTILFALHPIAGKYCKLIADLAEFQGGGPGFGGDDAESISVGKLQPVPLSEVCSSSLLPEASPSRGAASLGEWASFIGLHEKDEAVSLSENPLEPAASAFQGGLLRSLRASAALLPPPLVIDVLGFDNAVLALIAAYSHMLAMRHYHLDKRGMLLDPTAEAKEADDVPPPPREEDERKGQAKASAPTNSNLSLAYTILPKPAKNLSMKVFIPSKEISEMRKQQTTNHKTRMLLDVDIFHAYESVMARQYLLPFLAMHKPRPPHWELRRLEESAHMEASVEFVTATIAEELDKDVNTEVYKASADRHPEDLPEGRFSMPGVRECCDTDDISGRASDYLAAHAKQKAPPPKAAAPPPIPYAEAKAKLDAIAATETPALKAALCRTASAMNAANFMQFTPLIELCGLCIAMIAKGRSPAAIKELFAAVLIYSPDWSYE